MKYFILIIVVFMLDQWIDMYMCVYAVQKCTDALYTCLFTACLALELYSLYSRSTSDIHVLKLGKLVNLQC